jgi:hypothetical protein
MARTPDELERVALTLLMQAPQTFAQAALRDWVQGLITDPNDTRRMEDYLETGQRHDFAFSMNSFLIEDLPGSPHGEQARLRTEAEATYWLALAVVAHRRGESLGTLDGRPGREHDTALAVQTDLGAMIALYVLNMRDAIFQQMDRDGR